MNRDKRFFKIKYGYNRSDYVSVEEGEELEKAIYAMMKGTVTQIGGAFVKGANIISIQPHYHKHTGWYEYYEPTSGDDWVQIERDCPDYKGVVENTKLLVSDLIATGKQNLIGTDRKALPSG